MKPTGEGIKDKSQLGTFLLRKSPHLKNKLSTLKKLTMNHLMAFYPRKKEPVK